MPSLGYKGAGEEFYRRGSPSLNLCRAVAPSVAAGGGGCLWAVCWAAFKSKQAKPSIRMIAVLGGLAVFLVLAAFVFLGGR